MSVRESASLEKFETVDDLFPVGSRVFLVGIPYYGCSGIVHQPFDKEKSRCRVTITVKAEPDFSRLIARQDVSYSPLVTTV